MGLMGWPKGNGELDQYYGCWCPGSLYLQATNRHGIDHMQYVGPGKPWERISTTCTISVLQSGWRCKYCFKFLQIISASNVLTQHPLMMQWCANNLDQLWTSVDSPSTSKRHCNIKLQQVWNEILKTSMTKLIFYKYLSYLPGANGLNDYNLIDMAGLTIIKCSWCHIRWLGHLLLNYIN